jgi:hypothetical protein
MPVARFKFWPPRNRGQTPDPEDQGLMRASGVSRAHANTFEAYCQERWGWKRQYADRLIDAKTLSDILSPIGLKSATTESQLREIAPLIKTDHECAEDDGREIVSAYAAVHWVTVVVFGPWQ